mmetsp:Transcript_27266/g.48416  ORF Transcript_27266/g.48416 Transcript_27266/m.48416 type:complete len:296 (+) Transcript_27266:797-1684(+)
MVHCDNNQTNQTTELFSFLLFLCCREVENVSAALRAEFARGDGRIKRKEDDRRKNIQPSETLFVVNFHEETTKREDLKMLFEPYGELVRIDMKRNYAFVQFRTVEEATRAKDVTNGGQLEGSILTVEYVARQRGNDDRRGGGGRFRDRRGPPRRDYDRFDDRRGGRYDRGPPMDRDRDYDYRGGSRYDDRRRDRSPVGGYRSGSPGGYRGRSPVGGPVYRRSSRSRSRSPPRYRDDHRAGGYDDRYDRGGARYEDRDRDYPARGRSYDDSYPRDAGRGRSPEIYRGRGGEDRGYR